jgi:enoyl-CoA hydratase/carnithine racemase
MAQDKIAYHKKDHIGEIILNSSDKGNCIDLDMAIEIVETCNLINNDEDIYVAVLAGSDEIFCSGQEHLLDNEKQYQILLKRNPIEAIASLNCPVIAAINGDAIGEGLELALACDIRIASDRARFSLPQISLGMIPVNGGTQRLTRIIGKGKAMEMILTGDLIESPEALEIGLVAKVVPSNKVLSEVETIAKSLAAKAPFALRYCKEAINKGLDLTLEQGLRLEADLYFLLHTTADRTEGIQSFMQKRPPEFKGR